MLHDPNGQRAAGRVPGVLEAWKEFAPQFARWAQESSEKKAALVAEQEKTTRAWVEQQGGGVAVGAYGGVALFLGAAAASIHHAPGTLFDITKSIHTSYQAGGLEKVAADIITSPIETVRAAKTAHEAGDVVGTVQHTLNFFGQAWAAVSGARAGARSVGGEPPAPGAPAVALAGGGTAAVAGGGASVGAVGGGFVGSILGGIVSLATDVGNPAPEAPPVDLTKRAQQIQAQLVKEGGINRVRAAKTAVGVAQPNVPGAPRIVTVGSKEAYELFASGKLKLMPGEELGYAPKVEAGRLLPESHVEGLAANYAADKYGATGGELSTIPMQCASCEKLMAPSGWKHQNPRR